ncbi:hypothetical protein BABINDRAFT_9919 [Babjeviella inositovora NRRL Y-12698]|uniref:Peptidase S8/S53 domain-containing protein n=1 Tax=Babjeviella inositovora NRRL Y-12698 TaxID=984486 RepID=A0A1E3QIN1_9ASCO|nr:uncharacterized protein BABINDRAFT_9919 [Babjeviella inositovora NRRL Y-12698]ODQ77573.1 hypothetical protein BABINDRAFT_9919 [Babjeviella inositovora NRRL Y-12698]
MSSNILSVFNPPPSRDLTPEESKDCLPCQILGGCGALIGGTYLATGLVFRGEKPGINSANYKMCVRGLVMLLTRSSQVAIVSTLLAAQQINALVLPNLGEAAAEVFRVEPAALNSIDEVANIIESSFNAASNKIASKLNIELFAENQESKFAPVFQSQNQEDIIKDKYIIVFKSDVGADVIDFHQNWVAEVHSSHVGKLHHKRNGRQHPFLNNLKQQSIAGNGGLSDVFHIENAVSGYMGHFLPQTIEMIRRHPAVAFVEKDSYVKAINYDTQADSPWGLARISHREPLSLGSFNKYIYDTDGGEGVTSYIIDTGINVNHEDFEGRAKWGATIPQGDADVDGNGHGSHCAGTIGSKHYGVAKKASLVAVKVLRSNGSGSMSDVVKGVEYAANAHLKAVKENKKGFKGSTANMSLGGGKSPALDLAVNAAVKAGIHFSVAAGNDNADACNYSPAAAENAITVGASTIGDYRAYFSNYGKCVDIFAPGLNILSTYIGSNLATATLSGTSMAAPHVAGLLSYFLSLQPGADSEFFEASSGVTPAQLKKNVIAFGSKNVLDDIPNDGTPNILIYNGGNKNLTEFWGTTTPSTADVKAVDLKDLETKIDSLVESAKDESEHLLAEIKKMVSSAFAKY